MFEKEYDDYYRKTKGFYPFFKNCPFFLKEHYFSKRFYDQVGYWGDFKKPKTFNEKIRWLLFNENLKLKTQLTDKINVKYYVTEKIGSKYCAQLYGKWKTFKQIDFSILPDKFALKTNHGWKMNILVLDKTSMLKRNREHVEKTVNEWLQINYYDFSLEPQYKKIKKRIFAEKLRETQNGYFNYEYQVHCFNGEPKFVELSPPYSSVPFQGERVIQFYDTDWKIQPFTYFYDYCDIPVEKPYCLEEILSCAKKLSAGFNYVRVDFAFDENQLTFAEMTFSPSSCMIKFNDVKYDKMLGDMLLLG